MPEHKPELRSASIGLIGYGEVGKIFTSAFVKAGAGLVATWDLNFVDPRAARIERAHAAAVGVLACSSMEDLAARCGVIFSAVTAGQTLVAAREASAYLNPGALFVDVNSASPGAKAACADFVEANQGRYVEVAVMAAVAGYGLRVPMLLGGPHAAECAELLSDWGMDATDASDELGAVSAIKMCRSVVVKGLEALVIESFTAARAYGVEDAVVASLRQTFPGVDWEHLADDFYERAIRHGKRRAEEMRHSAVTVVDKGIDSYMASATAERQDWVARLAENGVDLDGLRGWRSRADRFLSILDHDPPKKETDWDLV